MSFYIRRNFMRAHRQEWETPDAIMQELRRQYGLNFDAACTEFNCKLPERARANYNGLTYPYGDQHNVFCNPPSDSIGIWLRNLYRSEANRLVFLLPVRSDTQWWMVYKPIAECHYFRGRIQYVRPPEIRRAIERGDLKKSNNTFASCLLCFGDGFEPGVERWRDAKTGKLL